MLKIEPVGLTYRDAFVEMRDSARTFGDKRLQRLFLDLSALGNGVKHWRQSVQIVASSVGESLCKRSIRNNFLPNLEWMLTVPLVKLYASGAAIIRHKNFSCRIVAMPFLY